MNQLPKWITKPYVYVLDISRSANQQLEENIRIDSNRDFVVTKIFGTQTSTYTIQLRDSGSGRKWSDNAINNANIVGTVNLPHIVPLPRRVKADSTIYFNVTDTSGSTNTIQIILFGYKIYKAPPDYENMLEGKLRKYDYKYIFDKRINSTSETQDNLKISSGHDFIIHAITGNSGEAYSLQIRDSDSNENWFETKIKNTNIIGSAQYPTIFSKPRRVKHGQVIYFSLWGTTGNNNDVEIVLHGYEVPVNQ
jgi:hypothetical protein